MWLVHLYDLTMHPHGSYMRTFESEAEARAVITRDFCRPNWEARLLHLGDSWIDTNNPHVASHRDALGVIARWNGSEEIWTPASH